MLAQSAVQCSRFYHFFKIFQAHKHAPLNLLAFSLRLQLFFCIRSWRDGVVTFGKSVRQVRGRDELSQVRGAAVFSCKKLKETTSKSFILNITSKNNQLVDRSTKSSNQSIDQPRPKQATNQWIDQVKGILTDVE